MAKTEEDIINDAVVRLQQLQPKADVSEGTLLRDTIESVAAELSTLYTSLDNLTNLIELTDPENIDSTTLDTLAGNYNLSRRAATQATGQITFRSTSNSTVTIPAGTSVSTPSSSTVSGLTYQTTAEVILDSSATFNNTTGYYEVDADIQAVMAGTVSNVGANSITILNSTITGIVSITNKLPITNGLNEESNTSLVNRIKLTMQGSVLGNTTAYELLFGSNENVNDILVIDPNNEFAERGPGAIDIYVEGEVVTSYTQTVTASSPGETIVYLDKTPALDISSISGYTKDVDYQLVKDTTSVYRYSISAKDYVLWLTTPPTTSYDISYTYNSLVETLQEVEAEDTNHIITNDIMIKSTVEVLINIDMTVYKLAGYSNSYIENSIIDAITTFVTTDRLGKNIRQSDIIGIVEGVTGVDYVDSPLTRLSLRTGSGVQDLLVENPFEYFNVDSDSFVIEVL